MITLSIGIPSYARPKELIDLLDSLYEQTISPNEIIICEDMSPQRSIINAISNSYVDKFKAKGCALKYIENDENLGYDRNLRKIISLSNSDYIILIGNDDVLLPNATEVVLKFIKTNPELNAVSRSILRFDFDVNRPAGISSLSIDDKIFCVKDDNGRDVFRLGAFIGGLIFKVDWAKTIATDKYDGGLYYQIYLMVSAFCTTGIGYIAKPIVGGRFGNPPLFGNSKIENEVHIPGAYAPKARAKMWATVINIYKDADLKYGFNLLTDVYRDLSGRQYFHIYEMYAGTSKKNHDDIRAELLAVGVGHGFIPNTLRFINLFFGGYAKIIYKVIRKIYQ